MVRRERLRPAFAIFHWHFQLNGCLQSNFDAAAACQQSYSAPEDPGVIPVPGPSKSASVGLGIVYFCSCRA